MAVGAVVAGRDTEGSGMRGLPGPRVGRPTVARLAGGSETAGLTDRLGAGGAIEISTEALGTSGEGRSEDGSIETGTVMLDPREGSRAPATHATPDGICRGSPAAIVDGTARIPISAATVAPTPAAAHARRHLDGSSSGA